jgi:trimeric autotransporter adhesin
VYINNIGVDTDEDTIRIGIVTPAAPYLNVHTKTFIAGIANATVSGSAVFVNSNGQLGITTSSKRFKENIRDMANASNGLLRLRPVTFQYKSEYAQSGATLQYGLIAEEVAEIYPELVQYDMDGKPFTVQYHLLTAMLLNELQKQHAALQKKDAEIVTLRKEKDTEIKALNARLTSLEHRDSEINALTARLAAMERIMERTNLQTSENRLGK